MNSTIIQVADAVTASLNAVTFTPPFHAKRKYRPVYDLATLAGLKVSVVPKTLEIDTEDRSHEVFVCAVDVAIQKKVDTDKTEDLDALMTLVETVIDHLRDGALEAMPTALWLDIANEPVFAPEHLRDHRVFTSLITVTYRVRR